MTNEEMWQSVLAQIQFHISRANFATWFRNTKIISKDQNKIVIAVDNSFAKEWINNKYSNLILKILRNLDQNIKSVEFYVKSSNQSTRLLKNKISKPVINNQQSFQELIIDKDTNLNPRYTFDNFIVGRFNELAHAAAWAISKNPGAVYNPLFIYGGVGLGKTHLLQATGNKIKENFPEKKVKYIPCEKFVSDVVDAIKNRNISEFKNSLKNIDVLIMDDVQFFAGKDKSQEEFFHIFNLLYQSQKQIILSSDRSPKAIPAIEERLRSRFEGGMIADIGLPDLETRIAILKTKCNEKGVSFNNDILSYIATNIRTNIRELEGALNRLIFFKKINNKNPDIETTNKLLINLIKTPKKTTTFKKIIQAVSEFYDITEKELLQQTRRKEIVRPRQIAMYLLREELNESYPSIGRKFNGKDHTTAMYAYNKINKEIKENDDLLYEINLIRQKIYEEKKIKK